MQRATSAKNRERFQEFYAQEQNREGLRQTMRREKAMEQLLTRAKGSSEPEVAAQQT